MDHGLKCVLQLLPQPVGLQDVDETKEDQEALPLVVPSRYTSRPNKTIKE